jgi:hypothetical protein
MEVAFAPERPFTRRPFNYLVVGLRQQHSGTVRPPSALTASSERGDHRG